MSRLKGFKHKESTKRKMSIEKTGIKNVLWKGDDVGYGTLHDWVNRWKGKAKTCQECGKSPAEWANIDHKYRRKLGDFISLCDQCYRTYDVEKKIFKSKHKYRGGK